MWHVSSRSGVATLRTAIHLLLTYLLLITYLLTLPYPETRQEPFISYYFVLFHAGCADDMTHGSLGPCTSLYTPNVITIGSVVLEVMTSRQTDRQRYVGNNIGRIVHLSISSSLCQCFG